LRKEAVAVKSRDETSEVGGAVHRQSRFATKLTCPAGSGSDELQEAYAPAAF
jgi:hypothetical protein